MRTFRSLIWVWLVLGSWASAAIIHVPADVPRIQDAINMATHGDTIVVAEGVYDEPVNMTGKNLTLTGTNPDDWGVVSRTIVQPPTGYTGPVVRFNGAETSACVLAGLTIQKGVNEGGIRGYNTHATISRCWVRNNYGSTCGGIWGVIGLIDRCRITGNIGGTSGNTEATGGLYACGDISNCLIADNSSSGTGGLRDCGPNITNCLIINNRSAYGASGIRCLNTVTVSHCTIANNFSAQNAPGVTIPNTGTVTNCIIWGNRAVDPTGAPVIRDVGVNILPTYSCYSNAPAEGGNISSDPQLGPGYSLTAGSPCIDAGTNTPPVPLAALDYRGGNRVIDGDDAASVVTDMGAIEFDPMGISLVVNPERLDFGGAGGVTATPVRTFEFYNLDGYSGNWQLDTAGSAWLTAEPANGTVSQTALTISVRVDPAGLAEGEYTCNLGVVVDGTTRLVVPIVLHVGKVIRVPQDVAQIQAAIVQVADWDTIVVSPGEYKENLDFLGKKICLRSVDPQDWDTVKTTIVNGRCQGTCVTINKGEGPDSIVEGLTIQLGSGTTVTYQGSTYSYVGGGLLCVDSSPTIRRCQICWNGYQLYTPGVFPPTPFYSSQAGGGIGLIGDCRARIEDCLLIENSARFRGAAIYAKTIEGREHLARSVVERCTISDNSVYNPNPTLNMSNFAVDGSNTQLQIRNTILWGTVQVINTDQIQFSCAGQIYQYTSPTYGTRVEIAGQNDTITVNPRFVMQCNSTNTTAYDYRLKADSLCINRGDPAFAGDGMRDLAGTSRVLAGRLDMGAFEFVPETHVVHPMEGDLWAAGSRHTIVWEQPNLDRVVISNAGFEQSSFNAYSTTDWGTTKDEEVPGWTIGPNSGAFYFPEQFDWMPNPQSKPAGFDKGSGIYQLLVDSYRPNRRYTLKLFVGSRKDRAAVTNWQAALTAGDRSTVIAAVTQAESGIPGLGKWITVSLALETGADGVDANVGKRIGILLTGAPFVEFDEVSLDVAELTPTATATVDVELSTDDGQNWQMLADDLLDTGSYPWTIGSDLASENCRIRAVSSWPDFVAVPSGLFAIRPYEPGDAVESRWPTEGHDMQRTGLAADNGPELGCVKWQYSTLTPISGNSVLGADERIIVASEGGDVDCLNADGQLIWKYSTRSPEEQLEGCWMMNDGSGVSAADCLGARNGNLYNFDPSGTQWVQDATFGTVLEFDGVDDYVRIPGYKGISGSQPRVCSAWIQTAQANTDIMMWGSNGASGKRWRIRLQERDGVGVLKAEINGGNILGCTPVNTGEWVHIRVVLPAGKTNSKDILLFINGVQEPAESVSILPIEIQTASDLDVHIGADLNTGTYFMGRMRDVRISTVSEGDGVGLGNLSLGPDGTVYVGDGSGVLHAVDSVGQLRWKHQTKAMIAGAAAVTEDGKVIFGSVDGTVVALGADGSELWSFAVPGPGKVGGTAVASPTIGRDGNVYVGGMYNGKLYALDAADGLVVWTCDFGGTANPNRSLANAPAVATDGTIYATLLNDTRLYAVNPSDGSIAWTTDLAGTAGGDYSTDYPTRYKEVYPWASPAIGPDGTIYVAFDDPYVRAVNPDGTLRWARRLGMVGGFSISVGANGRIYAAGDDRSLYVLDGEGIILSRFDGSNWLSWPVIGADETLYVSDFSGMLWAIAPQPCEEKSERLARPADITLDGKVRLEDLAELAKVWKECTDLLTGSPCLTTGSGWKRIANAIYLSGDIDRDYYVRLSDLLAMAEKWLNE